MGVSMKPLILVIDEENEIVDSLKRLLEADNYRVFSTFSGDLLREAINREQPSLAIVNLRVPKEFGLSIVKNLKLIAPSLPVIGVTVFSESFSGHEVRDYGIDVCFSKPFDVDQFRQSVARLAKLSKKDRHCCFFCLARYFLGKL